jgi:hypothetical protein
MPTEKQRMTVRERVEQARQTLNLNNRLALNIVETAAALGVDHTVTVSRLVQRGLLHPSRASRRPLFPVTEIQRFLAETR